MRGVYEAVYKISGVAAAKTLAYLTAPATAIVEILGASVTDASNETNEQLDCFIKKIGTLGTPTATSLTPSKTEDGDQAAGSTVKANVTASEPTYTSNTEVGWEGASSLSGWFYDPIPEERKYVPPGGSVGIYLNQAITAADLVVRLRFREVG
jgi:hypothetical protein